MQIITDPQLFQSTCLELKRQGASLALVPTMGALHDGHKSLLLAGRNLADKLVLTIFVNPTQFGPREDFASYPRDLERDCALARACGTDIVFAPDSQAMYAPNHATWVEVPELAQTLCGATRPGHFRGVCTVVLKLFNLARPDIALFGEKDRQQLCIIKKMAADLNLNLEVRGCPTVREADGLALSSRNQRLSAEERRQAAHIIKGLRLAESLRKAGETSAAKLKSAVLAYWQEHMPGGAVDYLDFVHPDNLATLETLAGTTLAATAVKFSQVRLIDNILMEDNPR